MHKISSKEEMQEEKMVEIKNIMTEMKSCFKGRLRGNAFFSKPGNMNRNYSRWRKQVKKKEWAHRVWTGYCVQTLYLQILVIRIPKQREQSWMEYLTMDKNFETDSKPQNLQTQRYINNKMKWRTKWNTETAVATSHPIVLKERQKQEQYPLKIQEK